jgi:hypothetical protein
VKKDMARSVHVEEPGVEGDVPKEIRMVGQAEVF